MDLNGIRHGHGHSIRCTSPACRSHTDMWEVGCCIERKLLRYPEMDRLGQASHHPGTIPLYPRILPQAARQSVMGQRVCFPAALQYSGLIHEIETIHRP